MMDNYDHQCTNCGADICDCRGVDIDWRTLDMWKESIDKVKSNKMNKGDEY